MADILHAAITCLGVMSELAPPQRRRLLSVLTAALDLGDDYAPSMLATIPAPAPVSVEAAPLRRTGRSPKARTRGNATMAAKGARTAEQILSLLRTSRDGMTPAMVSTATKMKRSTAQYWLMRLEREGRARKLGSGKQVFYRLSAEAS